MGTKKIKFKYTAIGYQLLAISFLTGCAKVETTRTNTVTNTTAQSTVGSDEVMVNDEFDQAVDDAISVICNHQTTILNAYIDTSRINLGVIEIDYGGKEADGTKSRLIANDSIHLPMTGKKVVAWGTPGTSATLTFGDDNSTPPEYEVNFDNNNTSLRIVGNAVLTNMNNGTLKNLASPDSLEVQIRSSIAYTWNDQTVGAQTFTWNLNQIRTFTMSGSTLNATTRGDTSLNGISGVSSWGTDRLGNSFYTVINTGVIQNISTATLSYNPLSGIKTIEGISEPIRLTCGVNQQGNVISGSTPYGFLISWVDNDAQGTDIIPYYY